MQFLQLDMELKMELNTIMLEIHGELIGAITDMLRLEQLMDQVFVVSKNFLFILKLTECMSKKKT